MIVVFDRGSDGGGALRLSAGVIFCWFDGFGFTTIGGAGSTAVLDSGLRSGSGWGIALPAWPGAAASGREFS
jgi:hypothetical protein